jgi:hypothetical protein
LTRQADGFFPNPQTRQHEHIHVRQCERWGPFFLPAYGVASVLALLREKPSQDSLFL